MEYREFAPAAALRPYVDCFWTHNGKLPVGQSYTCAPSGNTDLLFATTDIQEWILRGDQWTALPTAFINGLWTQPAFIRAQQPLSWFGIRLRPETFIQLFNRPLRELENSSHDLRSVLGPCFAQLSAQIMESAGHAQRINLAESFLSRELSRRLPQRNYLSEAMQLIRKRGGAISTDELCREVFVSKRQLQRAFQEHFGVSPKLYSRIMRFNRANYLIQTSSSISWTHLTYDCGYADQAHFIRDFREFTGTNPTALIGNQDAVAVLPMLAE